MNLHHSIHLLLGLIWVRLTITETAYIVRSNFWISNCASLVRLKVLCPRKSRHEHIHSALIKHVQLNFVQWTEKGVELRALIKHIVKLCTLGKHIVKHCALSEHKIKLCAVWDNQSPRSPVGEHVVQVCAVSEHLVKTCTVGYEKIIINAGRYLRVQQVTNLLLKGIVPRKVIVVESGVH
jgi:hypothetical protein